MPPHDVAVRKQLLLTRIALERSDWIRDVDALRRHLTPAELLSSLLHRAAGGGLASALFGQRGPGPGSPATLAGRLMAIALMVRRHPLWWPVVAGVLPWLRGRGGRGGSAGPSPRGGGKGKLLLAGLGAAGLAALWWVNRSGPDEPHA